jgi:voltage-gated potassium channel
MQNRNMNYAPRADVALENACLYISNKKYELLFISFMLLIFADTFAHHLLLLICNILQNMIIGLVIFYKRKILRVFTLFLIVITLGLSLFGSELINFLDVKSWQGIIYLIYFFIVAKEVYKELLYSKTVNRELLAAVLCGFVLLCLICTFLFFQIELKYPNSFSNIENKGTVLENLNYFSFTTMLTIGFGDIVPLSLVAKRAVMLMGLMGHFYTVFVTSIIVGKYLSARNGK